MNDPRIIVAIDVPDERRALELADRLTPALCRLKVGLELFTAAGPGVVGRLMERGYELFLDLKFHDIPNTVAGACRAAANLGVWMINVHALGGGRMLAAAREAVDGAAYRPLLTAVTVLTSHGPNELREIGEAFNPNRNRHSGTLHGRGDIDPATAVECLAEQAHAAGLDGIVCSPWEAAAMRARFGPAFKLVTPGVRPAGSAGNDQQRIMTPLEAVRQGADYLVIGRPVTAADDPQDVLHRLHGGLAALDSDA